MEATRVRTTNAATPQTAPKAISKTAQWARAHKWSIELVDPELQKRCKSYKDGKKVKLYEDPA